MYEYKNKYILNFSETKTWRQLNTTIRDTFDFPAWYEHSGDAFWDCITDMIGNYFIDIEIVGVEKANKQFTATLKEMVEILGEAKHYDNDRYIDTIRIVVGHEDGTYEEID